MPETTIDDREQGISRLAMLAFLAGKPGPWNGSPTGSAQWVRYRGHVVTRTVSEVYESLLTIGMLYSQHDNDTAAYKTIVRPADAIARLRDLDDLIDAILEVWPLDVAEAPAVPDLAGILLEAANTQDALHTAWVNSHDEWLKAFVLEQTDRFDGLRRRGIIPDRGDDVAAGNTAGVLGPYRTIEGVKLATLDEAGSYAVRLEGILRHVHDLVKRGASLDEIDQGLHAARSADQRITADDRARTEVDLEVDGKAIARAEEADTDA